MESALAVPMPATSGEYPAGAGSAVDSKKFSGGPLGAKKGRTVRDLSELDILVVENNAHMRKVLVALLNAFGVRRVLEAEDSLGGFSLIATEDIDLVLLDFFLGNHDGYDIIELLRGEKPCPNHNVPIIIVTAAPLHPRVILAKQIGADAVLGKPLMPIELYESIAQVLVARKIWTDTDGDTASDPATDEQRAVG